MYFSLFAFLLFAHNVAAQEMPSGDQSAGCVVDVLEYKLDPLSGQKTISDLIEKTSAPVGIDDLIEKKIDFCPREFKYFVTFGQINVPNSDLVNSDELIKVFESEDSTLMKFSSPNGKTTIDVLEPAGEIEFNCYPKKQLVIKAENGSFFVCNYVPKDGKKMDLKDVNVSRHDLTEKGKADVNVQEISNPGRGGRR